ncbi:glycosyltransferase [Niabella drilacis]|uniref:glycosyltransferase n=1 Tax=Niabella drilacis (strain DSM 25811 / CCM 8410 / CCUG 62505 / LMG 26954 / E90) TaxID=1285928 RepID=UPI001FE17C54|nr:glycosyltransferase [Niabella drilacis]
MIYELLKQGARVTAAGNRVQLRLLEKEFSQIDFQYLEGYNVHYTAKRSRFVINLAQQAPAILEAIRNENRWLRDIVREYSIDGVISDNRFGLYHAGIPTVFITHQLKIRNPLGRMMETLSRRINYRWIGRFSRCWIPDYPEAPGLAGALSHPAVMPAIPCAYIGPLSRMQLLPGAVAKEMVLILLSGPEPQRSLFEKIVCEQLPSCKAGTVLVRGLPNGGGPPLAVPGSTVVYDHLPAQKLNQLMCDAAYIICRSGYSSVMDLQAVGARPILVPTPGQTEQEYLAELLGSQHHAVICSQEQFNMEVLLGEAKYRNCILPHRNGGSVLEQAVEGFLNECKPG